MNKEKKIIQAAHFIPFPGLDVGSIALCLIFQSIMQLQALICIVLAILAVVLGYQPVGVITKASIGHSRWTRRSTALGLSTADFKNGMTFEIGKYYIFHWHSVLILRLLQIMFQ